MTTDNLTKLVAPVGFGLIASAGLMLIFWLNAAMLALGGVLMRRRDRHER